MKTFVFSASNNSISITISAQTEEDALAEIQEYFDNNGVEDLRLDREEDEDEEESFGHFFNSKTDE